MGRLIELPPSQKSGWPWNRETNPELYAERNDWPPITIVTPSYNQGKFIEETLRSVILQNYPKLEYIVMDGGSTDETPVLLEKYSKWIAYRQSEKDKGQCDALIQGFNRANGVLMNWINSDDILNEQGLYHIALAYLKNPGSDFIHGRNGIINSQSMPTGEMPHPDDDLEIRYLYEMPYGQQACFFTHEMYMKAGGINPDMRFSMDYELYLRMHLQGLKAVRTDKMIGSYRTHENTKTSTLEEIMHAENGNAFMTFLLSLGDKQKASFLGRLGHRPYSLYKVQRMPEKKTIRKAFVRFLKKYIWYYYNSGKRKAAMNMALQIVFRQPLNIFNRNYIKIIKDGII